MLRERMDKLFRELRFAVAESKKRDEGAGTIEDLNALDERIVNMFAEYGRLQFHFDGGEE